MKKTESKKLLKRRLSLKDQQMNLWEFWKSQEEYW